MLHKHLQVLIKCKERKYTVITDPGVAGAWVCTTTGQSHCGPNSLSSWPLLPCVTDYCPQERIVQEPGPTKQRVM